MGTVPLPQSDARQLAAGPVFDLTPLGVITGLAAEADCVRAAALAAGVPVPRFALSGGRTEGLEDKVAALIAGGARRLASFGLAGGLDPALRPGQAIVAREVVEAGGGRIPTTERWRRLVLARSVDRGLGVAEADLLGSDTPLVHAAAKAGFGRSQAVAAVDMESHVTARAAIAAGLPFVVLRVIVDPAGRSVPPAALVAVGPDGRLRLGALLGSLARSPAQIAPLIALGRDARAARAGLRRVAPLLLLALADRELA